MEYVIVEKDSLGVTFTYIEAHAEDGTVAIIPDDPNNSDYKEYLSSLEGATK